MAGTQGRTPPAVAPRKIQRHPGGQDTQEGPLVLVKRGDEEDKDKQLVLRTPLQTPAIYSGPSNNFNPVYEEVLMTVRTVTIQRQKYDNCMKPPSLPPARHVLAIKGPVRKDSVCSLDEKEKEEQDDMDLVGWWKKVQSESWDDLSKNPQIREKGEAKIFTVKAKRVQNAMKVYNLLLTMHGETLKNHISDLLSVADNLDKVSKGTKIAGITGGATGAVGGVAAIAGLVLAPVTFGASLALTAVGVGVAAAGGVTGASAAIAHKVNSTQDRKKIERILEDYQAQMDDIDGCLRFIKVGMEHLRQHNMATLMGVDPELVRVVRVAGGNARAIEVSSKAAGVLEGFTLGLDIYYKKGKKSQQLKKGLASAFAMKIRKVAEQLNSGLDELFQVKESFRK